MYITMVDAMSITIKSLPYPQTQVEVLLHIVYYACALALNLRVDLGDSEYLDDTKGESPGLSLSFKKESESAGTGMRS